MRKSQVIGPPRCVVPAAPPPWAMPRLVDAALSVAARHIKSRITGRVGNVRATSEKPAARNIAMVPE